MKTLLSSLSLIILSTSLADAKPRVQHLFDASLGWGKTLVPQLSYQLHFRAVGKSTSFYLGPGLRVFGAAGSNWRFAEENAPNDNFLGGDKNVNAIVPDDILAGSFNLGIYFRLTFLDRWELGANTDLIGVSFGRRTTGTLELTQAGTTRAIRRTRPKTLSVFPVSGSYNTEMGWLGYHVSERLVVRAGFLFSDYKYQIDADDFDEVSEDTYERIYPMGLIGVHYILD